MSYGVSNQNCGATIRGTTIEATFAPVAAGSARIRGAVFSVGIRNLRNSSSDSFTVRVDNSQIVVFDQTVNNGAGFDMRIGGTLMAGGANLSNAISEPAIDALFAAYRDGASLRRVLQIAHVALAEAINAGDDAVRATHVTAIRNAP